MREGGTRERASEGERERERAREGGRERERERGRAARWRCGFDVDAMSAAGGRSH